MNEQDKLFDNIFKDEIKAIIDDKREIKSLQLPDGEMIGVGNRGITKIVAYCEPGEYCGVPWFAVYTNNEILSRVNAKCVESVIYKTGKEPGEGESDAGND